MLPKHVDQKITIVMKLMSPTLHGGDSIVLITVVTLKRIRYSGCNAYTVLMRHQGTLLVNF